MDSSSSGPSAPGVAADCASKAARCQILWVFVMAGDWGQSCWPLRRLHDHAASAEEGAAVSILARCFDQHPLSTHPR